MNKTESKTTDGGALSGATADRRSLRAPEAQDRYHRFSLFGIGWQHTDECIESCNDRFLYVIA